MKKLLFLILAAIMLLATLSGCDIAKQAFHDYMNSVTSGKTVRTTVTEEEFLAAMASNNFTADITATGDDFAEEVHYKISDSAFYFKHIGTTADAAEEYETYVVLINDVYCALKKTESGYVAFPQSSTINAPKLRDLLGDIAYNDLVYNEETKIYTYSVEDESGGMEFSFENGILKSVHLKSSNATGNVYDIGTTTVKLPKYIMNQDDSVRTTVTEEEFLAAMACNNFSASGDNYQGTHTGFAKTNGSVIYQYEYKYNILLPNNDASDTPKESETDFYFATIDNVQYKIVREADGYVAYKYDGTFEVPKLGDIFGMVSFSDYIYVEDARAYMYVTSNCIFTLGFENGVIKSARYTDSSSMTYDLFDFGTTVVELPEFTYAPTDSQ